MRMEGKYEMGVRETGVINLEWIEFVQNRANFKLLVLAVSNFRILIPRI
jgi:hypothetical protein